jgi:lambda family phage portal protein
MKSTVLDRFVGWWSPATGLKRALARRALAAARAYDGAAVGRRTDGWRTASTSADTEIAAGGSRLRDRMRDLVRNNPHAAKAVAVLVNNIVGAHITPRAATGEEALDRTVNDLWEQWAPRADADGLADFQGLVSLAVRGMIEGGDVFARRRLRRAADGLPVPLQVQLLEADHLDDGKIGVLSDGGRIVRGIEYDAIGTRRAYWLFPDHPGDVSVPFSRSLTSVRVPADGVVHLFERQRLQSRGVPWGAPAMRALRDLDDWTNAELVRKKTEACLVGVVIGADETEQGVAPSVVDGAGKTIEQFEPGLIAYARGGKDIKFNQPASTAGVSEWLRAQLHIIAAGFRVPYELLTGDLSQVNYSSLRGGLVEFRRMCMAVQWQLVIPVFCQPVWDWFCEAAWTAGLIPRPTIRVEWQPHGFDAVDPLKDATADLLMLRSGTLTLPQAVAKQGYDPRRQLAEIAEFNALLDALGIVLDSDPRRMTKAGTLQLSSDDEDNANGDAADGAGRKDRILLPLN